MTGAFTVLTRWFSCEICHHEYNKNLDTAGRHVRFFATANIAKASALHLIGRSWRWMPSGGFISVARTVQGGRIEDGKVNTISMQRLLLWSLKCIQTSVFLLPLLTALFRPLEESLFTIRAARSHLVHVLSNCVCVLYNLTSQLSRSPT